MSTAVALLLLIAIMGSATAYVIAMGWRPLRPVASRARSPAIDPGPPAPSEYPGHPRWWYIGEGPAYSLIDGVPHKLSLEDDGVGFTVRIQRKGLGQWRIVRTESMTDRKAAGFLFDAWWVNPPY